MPSDDTDIIFQCTVDNICSTKHTTDKKRRVKGKRRALIADKMIEQRKNTISFRREEAKRKAIWRQRSSNPAFFYGFT